ncbi:MAG TPA: hypothetical protein PKY15_03450 [Methanoregulaceae archaeon]|jgi:hypothetical protein|nr:hypothetical protein [Methanoregulaceae archaeon]MDD5686088.1 hypothetical protein [Methanoregulaceae archaeon]HQC12396.1 hypothetical protein [Methanoregulaceae archaeon]
MELSENIRAFLEGGEDWERKITSIRGVSLLKLPGTKTRPASLAIEINPVNEKGMPMKRKGVIVTGSKELRAFREIFGNEKLDLLMDAVEEITPGKKKERENEGDILHI